MRGEPESPYAWLRLSAALTLMTLGGSGMYAISVALAPVQAEFGVTRADASLPYTLTMLGFGIGGILMGKLSDRFGVMVPTVIGAVGLGSGFVLAGNAQTLWQFSLAHGILVGLLGCSATFAPLVAASRWRSAPAATTSPARSGRRSCNTDSTRSAGATPTSAPGSSAPRRCWCWRLRYARGRLPSKSLLGEIGFLKTQDLSVCRRTG
jgi:MFS family permease